MSIFIPIIFVAALWTIILKGFRHKDNGNDAPETPVNVSSPTQFLRGFTPQRC
jgi:hypothetical protein